MSGETTNTCYMPANRLVELYELKSLSPVEVVKEALARIADVDGDVNAIALCRSGPSDQHVVPLRTNTRCRSG